MTTALAPVFRIPRSSIRLADGDQWVNRFEIQSESSSRVYIVSQHRENKHWGCSCPAWRTRRACKHLSTIGLPGHETPYEPRIIQ